MKRVAVAGATGRTGKLVVQQLLSQNVPVLALVRDTDKAMNTLDPTNELLTIRQTDLGSKDDVIAAVKNEGECDAAIWCATGFSDAPDQSFFTKVKSIPDLLLIPKDQLMLLVFLRWEMHCRNHQNVH